MAGRTDRHALDLEFDVLLAQMASAGGETGRAVIAELRLLWRQQPGARGGMPRRGPRPRPAPQGRERKGEEGSWREREREREREKERESARETSATSS